MAEEQYGALFLDGGKPVRETPLPEESPGIHFMNNDEIKAVTRVLSSRSPFRFYGPAVQDMCGQFEQAVCEKTGAKYAIAVNSGTEALAISLAAMEVGPGDEVLIPGYLWTSCINAVIRVGAIPLLVDIDDTFTMDPEDLKKKITRYSKAVLYINMSGCAGHIDQIAEICRENDLYLLEDNCQAMGGTFKGRHNGTLGDIATVSFQINKVITAGEGGLIMVREDEHLFRRCFGIHDLGYARDDWGVLMDTSCDEQYHMWGAGARMSEIQGAVLCSQYRKINQIVSSLHRAKYRILDGLKEISGLRFRHVVDPEGDTGCFIIAIYPDEHTCRNMVEAVRGEGIVSKGYAKPLIRFQEWGLHLYYNNKSLVNRKSVHPGGWPWTLQENEFAKDYEYGRGILPVCDDLFDRAALYKVSPALTEQDIDDIIRAHKKAAFYYL